MRLDAGYWILDTGYWILDTGYWMLDTGYWMTTNKHNVNRGFLRSFGCAMRGIGSIVKGERNFRIHLGVATLVILAGFFFRLAAMEWVLITITIGLVLAMEAINSAVEKLTDMVSPGFDARAGKVKDIAAGAVLITAVAAVIVGMIIFGPKIVRLLTY